MKQFTTINDVDITVESLIQQGIDLKKDPHGSNIGKDKTLGMIFFNPSLRTRMSTQKAAQNLGMEVISMNISEEGWKIELEDGAVMDGGSQEHIKDAVKVMSGYVDVLGVRTFASLINREEDYAEKVLNQFIQYSSVPVVSLESATLHPLQSLADMMTIAELGLKTPKVVISWAPHPRALPQAVPNSFLQWSSKLNFDLILTCPEGYELSEQFMDGVSITHDQEEAFENADIVYAKNWSSYQDYGQILNISKSWMIDSKKMALTREGRFMHCLPVRRNVVVSDEVMDNGSLVYTQANNRVFAAQAVLKNILEG